MGLELSTFMVDVICLDQDTSNWSRDPALGLRRLPVILVDPLITSKISMIGGTPEFINYKWAEQPYGLIDTGSIIAS